VRLLLAEDNDDLREMLSVTLQQAGWEVFAARDGRDALRIYHDAIQDNDFFDVLLLDVEMPRLNGFAVGANVRNLEKYSDDVPRAAHVYLTGYDHAAPPEQLLETLFADGYIRKPVEPDALVNEINTLVNQSQ
jgi:CheY-like chemotaxis protein